MERHEQIRTLAQLTDRHPEWAVELVDQRGVIRFVLFSGMSHPECLPTGGTRARDAREDPYQAVVAANLYPRARYEDAAWTGEPGATGVGLEEAIKLIAEA